MLFFTKLEKKFKKICGSYNPRHNSLITHLKKYLVTSYNDRSILVKSGIKIVKMVEFTAFWHSLLSTTSMIIS